jgi:hypothetical protein
MGQAYANIQGYSLWFNQTSIVNSCVSIHVGSDMTEHQIPTYFLYLNHVNLNKRKVTSVGKIENCNPTEEFLESVDLAPRLTGALYFKHLKKY